MLMILEDEGVEKLVVNAKVTLLLQCQAPGTKAPPAQAGSLPSTQERRAPGQRGHDDDGDNAKNAPRSSTVKKAKIYVTRRKPRTMGRNEHCSWHILDTSGHVVTSLKVRCP